MKNCSKRLISFYKILSNFYKTLAFIYKRLTNFYKTLTASYNGLGQIYKAVSEKGKGMDDGIEGWFALRINQKGIKQHKSNDGIKRKCLAALCLRQKDAEL